MSEADVRKLMHEEEVSCASLVSKDQPSHPIKASKLPSPPKDMDEVRMRMDAATAEVQYRKIYGLDMPVSLYTTADKMKLVEEGLNERYIVRVIPSQFAGNAGEIGRPGAKGSWATTYATHLRCKFASASDVC